MQENSIPQGKQTKHIFTLSGSDVISFMRGDYFSRCIPIDANVDIQLPQLDNNPDIKNIPCIVISWYS